MDRAGSALRRARALQERLYADTCTVHAVQKLTDPQTHVTGSQWVAVIENQPCRVSFSQFPATGQNATADTVSQSVKLFISPEVAIPAGSRIEITRQGITTAYRQSGQPAMYPTHQELMLELEKEHP